MVTDKRITWYLIILEGGFNMSYYNNGSGYGGNQSLREHMRRFIGQTVLVFTTSGGQSGMGFSGVLLAVNCDFIRILDAQGTAPTCPISDVCRHDGYNGVGAMGMGMRPGFRTGSVCDIPIDRIASFCHNAI
ncbi:MAG: hypothetical protein K0S41_2835 [Anaerocolumna sp.]|jgi:hypothetical protein|nr:hypothetical protein [Anaerocolumna sp.]